MPRSFAIAAWLTATLLSAVAPMCRAGAESGSFLRLRAPLAEDDQSAVDEMLDPQTLSFIRSLDGRPPPALIQTGLNEAPDEPAERVLFIVYSDSKFYDTRLRWVMETWGSAVPNGTIVAIGDKAAPAPAELPVRETQCPRHSHEEGACCKYGEAVIEAGERMQRDPTLGWVYFMDDDVYARPEAIARYLNGGHDEGSIDTSNGLVRGTFLCGTDPCSKGLCGGGGYAASRRAVEVMLSDGPADFLRKQMENCNKCNRWADLAVSQFVADKNITKASFPGVYGWRMQKGQFDKSLERGSPDPLLYHYVQSEQQMSFLHSLFGPAKQEEPERRAAEERAGAEVISRVVARVISRVVSRLLGRPPLGSGCAAFHGKSACHHGAGPGDVPWYAPGETEAAAKALAEAAAHQSTNKTASAQPPGKAGVALAELLVAARPSAAPAEP